MSKAWAMRTFGRCRVTGEYLDQIRTEGSSGKEMEIEQIIRQQIEILNMRMFNHQLTATIISI